MGGAAVIERQAAASGADADDGLVGLCRTLRTDPDAWNRWAAATALGTRGDSAAIPALLSGITDAHPAVRLCVAEALGRLGAGDPRVAPALCCLLVDSDRGVRAATLEALGDVRDPVALPAVRTRLAAERGIPDVRLWVLYALARLGDAPFPVGRVIGYLRRYRTIEARIAAARVLSRAASPETAERIMEALEAAAQREAAPGVQEALRQHAAAVRRGVHP